MRKDPEAREPTYTAVYVRLPTFAVLILRHRARRTRKSFAAIVEDLILDNLRLVRPHGIERRPDRWAFGQRLDRLGFSRGDRRVLRSASAERRAQREPKYANCSRDHLNEMVAAKSKQSYVIQ